MSEKLFYELSIAGHTLPLFLHSVGFILLYKAKRTLPNQRIVTMDLAAAEVLYCLWQIVQYIIYLTKFKASFEGLFMFIFLHQFVYLNIALIYIIIIADRFLYIWLNIKYTVYITKKKLSSAMGIQWFIAALIALIPVLLFRNGMIDSNHYINTILAIELVLDISIITIFFLTFIYFFLKVKNATKQSTSQQRGNRGVISFWTKLKIPCLMVVTFITFNIGSTIIKHIQVRLHGTAFDLMLYIIVDVLTIVGWCSDALTYILLQKRVRCLVSINRGNTDDCKGW